MSLYYVQKFLFELNRSPDLQAEYWQDRGSALASYEVTDEERSALVVHEMDVGVMGDLARVLAKDVGEQGDRHRVELDGRDVVRAEVEGRENLVSTGGFPE